MTHFWHRLATTVVIVVLGVPITFDAKGDIASAPVNIFQVKDGDFVLVKAMTSP